MSSSTYVQLLAGLLAGGAGGVLSGVFGVGGGVILTPILHLALGLDQHRAQGVTLAALLLPNSLPALIHFRRQGVVIRWGVVGLLILAFLPGIWLGARIANSIPEVPLRWGFAAFLVLLAAQSFFQKANLSEVQASEFNPVSASSSPVVAIGLIGGLAAGLLGIGGGVVMIPLLTLWQKLSQLEAQVTSLAVLLPPIGLPGLWVYAHGHPDFPWFVLAGLAFGFAFGTYVGAHWALRIPGQRLRKSFAIIMVLMALLMVVHTS